MHLSREQAQQAISLISSARTIVVTSHKSPDGDAVGSALALYRILKKLNRQVTAILPDEAPSFLQWMSGYDEVVLFDQHTARAEELIAGADLLFSLDYNHLNRVGDDMEKALRAAGGEFILIDHHQQPEPFAVLTYSDTASCSTAQLIYRFIVSCGWKDQIDPEVAECLYCGIVTDSGSFRFPSVTPETHLIAAELINMGLDHARVHREVFDTNLQDRLRLIGYALNEKLEVIPESATAFISLSQEELKRFNYRQGDTEGLVNQALSIRGIKLAAFFREGSNEIKVSFRSKGTFDVNTFARQGWNGGGHRNAAGGSSLESLEATVERFRKEVSALSEQISHS